jgi:hypothetical protein
MVYIVHLLEKSRKYFCASLIIGFKNPSMIVGNVTILS